MLKFRYIDRALKHDASPLDHFIYSNLALLSSTTGKSCLDLLPQTTISLEEIETFKYALSAEAKTKFRRSGKLGNDKDTTPASAFGRNEGSFIHKLESLRKELGLNFYWAYDDQTKVSGFLKGGEVIQERLTNEEAVVLVKKLLPRIEGIDLDNEENVLTLAGNLMHPVKHLDIITDPDIGRYFETWAIPDHAGTYESSQLVNFLIQHYFPSFQYFEKVFASAKEYTQKDFVFDIPKEGLLPASIIYFTLLRQLVNLDKYVNNHSDNHSLTPKEAKRMKYRIVGYLFSDGFMKRALPYLESNEEYPDDIVQMEQLAASIKYDLTIVKRDKEAKEDKAERFREVLQAADAFLRAQGDNETADRLRTII